MKIIDLLNKIANDEELPKKIKYLDIIFEYDERLGYITYNKVDAYHLECYSTFLEQDLNSEVEIIEESEKIEKYYEFLDTSSNDMKSLRSRVNELTDTLNKIIDKFKE